MSGTSELKIPIGLNEYVDKLEREKNNAERMRKQRVALYNRAVAAQQKAKLVESSLKSYKENIEATDNTVKSLDDALYRAAILGDKMSNITGSTVDALQKLAGEISDVSKKTEGLKKKVEKLKEDIKNNSSGIKSDVDTCTGTVLKTIEPSLEKSLDALEKTLAALKVVGVVHELTANTCGINHTLVSMMQNIRACCFPLQTTDAPSDDECIDCSTEQGIEYDRLVGKYGNSMCEIPEPKGETDTECACEYGNYLKLTSNNDAVSCSHFDNANAVTYYNDIKSDFTAAEKLAKVATEWLNCTTEAKNLADARFNACKAAFDAAVAAKKC